MLVLILGLVGYQYMSQREAAIVSEGATTTSDGIMDELLRGVGASTCSMFEAVGGARFLQEIGCFRSDGEWAGDTWLIGLFTVFVLFFFLFGGGGFFFFSGGD